MFHHFLIWPLIAGLHSLEILIRKISLALLLLGRLKDFLEIKGSSQHQVGGEWFEIKLGDISRKLVK